jgi:hypothetical protein
MITFFSRHGGVIGVPMTALNWPTLLFRYVDFTCSSSCSSIPILRMQIMMGHFTGFVAIFRFSSSFCALVEASHATRKSSALMSQYPYHAHNHR